MCMVWGERSTKSFLNLDKKKALHRQIRKLIIDNQEATVEVKHKMSFNFFDCTKSKISK